MKKIALILAFFGLLFSAAPLAAQDVKIVTVSMQRLFDGYFKRDDVDQRLQSVQQEAQAEQTQRQTALQEKEQAILAMREELDNPMLSDDAKAEKEEEIRAAIGEGQMMMQEFQQWQQQTAQRLQRRQQELRNTLVEEIKLVVVAVANDEGADLVFDTSDILNTGTPPVLYADPRLDITNKVLNELNKDAP